MWDAIRTALTSVQDALGIEIPELPGDLAGAGDAATTAVQSVTESATAAVDSAATAGDALVGGATAVADGVPGIPAAALETVASTQADVSNVLGAGTRP